MPATKRSIIEPLYLEIHSIKDAKIRRLAPDQRTRLLTSLRELIVRALKRPRASDNPRHCLRVTRCYSRPC